MKSFAIGLGLVIGIGCGNVPLAEQEMLIGEEGLQRLGSLRGVTIDPEGTRWILDEDGLHQDIYGDSWLLVWAAPEGVQLEDVVALGSGQFALTSRDMGYILNLTTGSFRSHFCYVPESDIREEEPPPRQEPTVELARAVAYDADSNMIYAQPQTVVDSSGSGVFSELAMFDRASGTELVFVNLNDASFSAGGMALLEDQRFLAGQGRMLWTLDFATGSKETVLDLRPFDVQEIEGLAINREEGLLYVLDGPTQRLLTLRLPAF